MRAQELAVLSVEDQFHKSLCLVRCNRTAAELEWEFTDAQFVAGLSGGFLREPDTRDTWVRIGATRDIRVVNLVIGKSAEPLDAADRFVRGDMRQPRWANHVANRVDPRNAGDIPVFWIRFDVVLDDFELQLV